MSKLVYRAMWPMCLFLFGIDAESHLAACSSVLDFVSPSSSAGPMTAVCGLAVAACTAWFFLVVCVFFFKYKSTAVLLLPKASGSAECGHLSVYIGIL